MKSFKQYIEEKRTKFVVTAYDPVYGYMDGMDDEIDGIENPKTKGEVKQFLSRSGSVKFIADKTDNALYLWNGINALHGQIGSGLGIPAKNKTVRGDIEKRQGKYILWLSAPYSKHFDDLFSIKAVNPLGELLGDFQKDDLLIQKQAGW
jgi:hypothetical protein